MIVLGVDPGTLITGYGIVEKQKNEIRLIESGIIQQKSSVSIPLRLKNIYDKINSCIEKYLPDEFAIETAFYGKNIQSTMKIGHARGVSILAAVNHQLPITEYSPREVKKAVTGNGSSSKQQVLYMVNQILKNTKKKMSYDEADALAISLCHLQKIFTPVKNYKNWKSFIEDNPKRVIK